MKFFDNQDLDKVLYIQDQGTWASISDLPNPASGNLDCPVLDYRLVGQDKPVRCGPMLFNLPYHEVELLVVSIDAEVALQRVTRAVSEASNGNVAESETREHRRILNEKTLKIEIH